jgi:hypothetical protein
MQSLEKRVVGDARSLLADPGRPIKIKKIIQSLPDISTPRNERKRFPSPAWIAAAGGAAALVLSVWLFRGPDIDVETEKTKQGHFGLSLLFQTDTVWERIGKSENALQEELRRLGQAAESASRYLRSKLEVPGFLIENQGPERPRVPQRPFS